MATRVTRVNDADDNKSESDKTNPVIPTVPDDNPDDNPDTTPPVNTETDSDTKAEFTRVGPTGHVNTEIPAHAANDTTDVVFIRNGEEIGRCKASEVDNYVRENGL